MVTALRMLGFDKVFDTDTGADLTIMEEGTELIDRIRGGGVLPLITSCSPGWIKFCEHNFPEMLPNLSSCKSPHQMLGAIIKSLLRREERHRSAVRSMWFRSCLVRQRNLRHSRPELSVDGLADVDAVITTRELGTYDQYDSGIDFPAIWVTETLTIRSACRIRRRC